MNAKIYNGNVQPNHKEYKIWVNDEGTIKTWNGTEWIESASSGGSGSGSGSGSADDKVIYYKFSEPLYLGPESPFTTGLNVFSGARGFYDISVDGYYYGTVDTINGIAGSKFSTFGYMDAFEFRPVQFVKSGTDSSIVTYNDFESFAEAVPYVFGELEFSRITAEEYWEHFNEE